MFTEELGQMLSEYKRLIDKEIHNRIPTFGSKGPLRDGCEYALTNGGKRFRPALVLMVAKALKRGGDALNAALAVELFHTASLVADDLPCMDDDDQRRNKPSLHKVYGEAVSLLVTYGLIAAGYEYLAKNCQAIKESALPYSHHSDRIGMLALENVSANTGFLGATGGQFMDIYPPNLSVPMLREIICKKTVTLFEISFVLGWLYGGGEHHLLDFVKKAAYHFGMAFQIADDIVDIEQDAINGRAVNMAAVLGKEAAIKLFHEELKQFNQLLGKLGLDTSELSGVAVLLAEKVS